MLITVESDEEKREDARACDRGATKAFGIPHRAVGTWAEALDLRSYQTPPRCMSDRAGA